VKWQYTMVTNTSRKRPAAIVIMTSDREKKELRQAADRAAMAMSVYVRFVALKVARGEIVVADARVA
jgi:hypothetical protein